VHEFATLITETVIMALKIDGKAFIWAKRMAMTKGEYLELAPVEFRRLSSLEGTMSPSINSETT
jgi:hypothetical protein